MVCTSVCTLNYFSASSVPSLSGRVFLRFDGGEGGGGCSVPQPWKSCLPRHCWRGEIQLLKGVMLAGNQMLQCRGDFGHSVGFLIDFPEKPAGLEAARFQHRRGEERGEENHVSGHVVLLRYCWNLRSALNWAYSPGALQHILLLFPLPPRAWPAHPSSRLFS